MKFNEQLQNVQCTLYDYVQKKATTLKLVVFAIAFWHLASSISPDEFLLSSVKKPGEIDVPVKFQKAAAMRTNFRVVTLFWTYSYNGESLESAYECIQADPVITATLRHCDTHTHRVRPMSGWMESDWQRSCTLCIDTQCACGNTRNSIKYCSN